MAAWYYFKGSHLFCEGNERKMKRIFIVISSILGGLASAWFGGWDMILQTLVVFMAIDWITGGILLPAVFHKSPKSENGTLESRAGFSGADGSSISKSTKKCSGCLTEQRYSRFREYIRWDEKSSGKVVGIGSFTAAFIMEGNRTRHRCWLVYQSRWYCLEK